MYAKEFQLYPKCHLDTAVLVQLAWRKDIWEVNVQAL